MNHLKTRQLLECIYSESSVADFILRGIINTEDHNMHLLSESSNMLTIKSVKSAVIFVVNVSSCVSYLSNCILSNLTLHLKLFGNVSVDVSLHLHISLAVIRWQLVINYLLCSNSQAPCRFVPSHFATVRD